MINSQPMRLFDTATGEVRDVEPSATVGIYVCGITPYDATHIGHAATYITYDVLQRRLTDRGHIVRMVRNITDIDNDLLERARRDGVNYLDLAFGQKKRFNADLDALGLLEPWSEPRATSAIPDIRGLVSRLVSSGAAYEVEGWVYFSHKASGEFGSVSGNSRVDMRAIGERRGEDPHDPRKAHPLDTVLWQPSAPDEPYWEAPWGRGRPGWHVECTALSLRELGGVEIHGGGCDLVYPHHEFCAAQLDALGEEPVGLWMHQSCVHLDGEPMSKSTGNLVFVNDILENHDPMALRLAVMSNHYRERSWDWTAELLEVATARLASWRAAGDGTGPIDAVRAALDDDLDVPTAIEAIDSAAKAGNGVSESAGLLGAVLN